jgi:hypothetical protein
MVELTPFGRFTAYLYKLEHEWRGEQDPVRRGKLLVRLAIGRIAALDPEPERAVALWRNMAHVHLPLWDRELEHPDIDAIHEYYGTDHLLSAASVHGVQRRLHDPEQRAAFVNDLAVSLAASFGLEYTGPGSDADPNEYLDIPE